MNPQQPPANGWYDTPAFDALAPSGSIAAQYLSFPGNGSVGKASMPAPPAPMPVTSSGSRPRTFELRGHSRQGHQCWYAFDSRFGQAGSGLDGLARSKAAAGPAQAAEPLAALWYRRRHCELQHDQPDQIYGSRSTMAASMPNVTEKDRIGFAIYWVPLVKD